MEVCKFDPEHKNVCTKFNHYCTNPSHQSDCYFYRVKIRGLITVDKDSSDLECRLAVIEIRLAALEHPKMGMDQVPYSRTYST